MHTWREANMSELRVGEPIKIVCEEISKIFRTDKNYIEGTIISLFDAGGEGLSFWQIEVRLPHQKWWMYEPTRYGGKTFVVQN